MSENKNRGSSFNEYKFECLMEDAKKLVEALEKANDRRLDWDMMYKKESLELLQTWLGICFETLEEFKANWEIK